MSTLLSDFSEVFDMPGDDVLTLSSMLKTHGILKVTWLLGGMCKINTEYQDNEEAEATMAYMAHVLGRAAVTLEHWREESQLTLGRLLLLPFFGSAGGYPIIGDREGK